MDFIQVKIEYKCFHHWMSILNTTTTVIEMLLCYDIKLIPISKNHFVITKFIMMPSRENEMCRSFY